VTIAPERTAAESDRRQVGKDPWPGTFKQLSSLVGLYGGSEQAEKIRDASPRETNFVFDESSDPGQDTACSLGKGLSLSGP